MFNKFVDHKNTEIAKIIQTISLERKIDLNKVFQITKFALLEVFTEIYGNAKIDIEINKNSSEMRIMQCFKVLSDEDAKKTKYIFVENNIIDESEKENCITNDFSKNLIFNYRNEEEKKNESNFIEAQLKKIENDAKFHYSVISLTQAIKHLPEIEIGEILKLPIENAWKNLENNSKLAKIFNKSFFRFIDGLIKEQEFAFFLKKANEGNQIINTFVKSINKDGYVLSYDNYEIILPTDTSTSSSNSSKQDSYRSSSDKKYKYNSGLKPEIIPGEYFGIGERIQVFIKLNKKNYNDSSSTSTKNQKDLKYQVIASRTHPGFLEGLLKQNVPEIRNGQILIKDVQRMPGVRSKVVVFSTDPNLDPVGSCIGIRGVRIKSISKEIRDEKIDIINYSDNLFDLASNALYPIKAIKISESESRGLPKLIITVDDKDLSGSIGKGGSNIKLISRILKCGVEIIGGAAEESRRLAEYQKMLDEFKEKLDIEEVIAQLLIMSNFKTIEGIASAEISDLLQIEYFDEELAAELQNRALEFLYEKQQEKIEKLDESLRNLIAEFDNDDQDLLKLFAEKEILTLSSLAELDIDELLEKFEDSCEEISEEIAEDLIISARKAINFSIE